MIKEEDVTEFKFDNLEGMLEDLWNATVEDLCNVTQSEDWYDIPSDKMTLEQARQAVGDLRKKLAEYLEQEPCDDAISRQAMLEIQVKYAGHMGATKFWQMRDEMKSLPPVTPQKKTGRWIFVDKAKEHARCSECDYGNVDLFDGRPHNYCPDCGAKMEVGE